MKLEKVFLKNAHISSVKGRVLRGEKMDTLYKVRENPSTFSKFYQIFGKWIGAVPKMHPHPLEDSVLASCTDTIGGKSYDTVCVMDIETYNCGVISEQFLDKNGKTIPPATTRLLL